MAADVVSALVRVLSADTELSTSVGGRIYGGLIPSGAMAPLVLVQSVSSKPTTRPTTQWWDSIATVDVHSEDPLDSLSIAQAVEVIVNTVSGSQPEGVFAVCEATGIASIPDGAFTPTRFRNIVTVVATARSN